MEPSPRLKLVLLVPVYDDWQCVRLLMQKLDAGLEGVPATVRILLLDDGSPTAAPAALVEPGLKNICAVESLKLRRNLGHQRAIAIGLCFVFEKREGDAVLVMDGDGEDRPEDVIRLIHRFIELGGSRVVFAERKRRSESLAFRVSYQVYRLLHRTLAGIPVKVGNFSIISRQHFSTLSVVSELWNHYAASVYKARLPVDLVPTTRGTRYAGQSKLNFVNLSIHGLSAISVFAETVGVRLMFGISVVMFLSLALMGIVLTIRFGTSMAIPGWATSAIGLLLIIVLQMLTLVVGLTFSVLFNRNNLTFLPIRDYNHFVGDVSTLYGGER